MSDASAPLLFLRVGVSLSLVLGMVWVAARVVRSRTRGVAKKDHSTIDVRARRSVGRRSNILMVEVAGRSLLVGVTEQHVALLADLSGAAPSGTGTATDAVDRPITVSERPVTATDLDDPTFDLTGAEALLSPRATEKSPTNVLASLRELTVRRT